MRLVKPLFSRGAPALLNPVPRDCAAIALKLGSSLPRSALGLALSLALWSWGLGVVLAAPAISAPATPAATPPAAFSTSPAAKTSIQPYLNRVIQNTTEFKLDNGMKFIVLERKAAPVVSFLTYADVGGVDELEGKTGAAHFLEHLAFKGTSLIGTTNYGAEKLLIAKLDALELQIRAAQTSGKKDEAKQLQAQFDQLETEAQALVKQNEYGQIVEQSGGVGLNANTSAEATRYFYSFPSNKLELWMSLESERFLDPVLGREFHKEKQVILEERRLRTDNSPIGQMLEAFLDKAYKVHPYRRPVIGYDSDIRNLTTEDIQYLYDRYYVPKKLTMVVVGDVNAAEVKRLAQIYFGRFQAKPTGPLPTLPVEPPQTRSEEVTLRLQSQPWYIEGYHRPAITHPDHLVYEMIGSILSDGRTARLYRTLVEQQKVALTAQGFSGFPGNKYPNLMLFYALTAPGKSVAEVQKALQAEINRLKTEPVSAEELDRVKTQARAGILRSLDDNSGMAELLAEYEVKTGSWRNLFDQLDKIAAVTPADIQRVAQQTFVPTNRTVGKILSK